MNMVGNKKKDFLDMNLYESLDCITDKIIATIPNLHLGISKIFRYGVDRVADLLSVENDDIPTKKLLYYSALSGILAINCIVFKDDLPLAGRMVLGGAIGALMQGSPHCQDQIDIEKKYPWTALAVGCFHGATCAFSTSALFRFLGHSAIAGVVNTVAHSFIMKFGMCYNENKVLNFMDRMFDAKREESCCYTK